jgi:glycosyltransferase involved in cell wall biosynthesis
MGGDLHGAAAAPVSKPLVSIALVTRNGATTLPALLEAVRHQHVDADVEIVAVDSGSTDGSADLLERSVDRLITIAPQTFNHGTTRNLAIERTRGDLVVLIVQDALPADDRWLTTLIAPLMTDAALAGTFARQVPRPEAATITREYLHRAPVAADVPRLLTPLTPDDLARLDPMTRFQRCSFDNVCSCIRRSVWQRFPFPATSIAEDIEWAKAVLLAGYSLQFVPGAVVVHSHDRSPAYELTRTRLLHQRLAELFDLRTIPTLPLLARAVASCLVLHLRLERDRPSAWPRAIGLAVAWPLGQYLGGRAR